MQLESEASVTEAVPGRCDRGVWRGGCNQPFESARSSHTECLARHAGRHGWSKRRRSSQAAKRQCLSGHGCRVEGGPPGRARGAILALAQAHDGGTHLDLRDNASPFAGCCGNRRSKRCFAPRSRGARHPVRAQRARGSASRSSARTTKEVRGAGSRRGLAPSKDGRTFARISPVPQARSFGSMHLRGSSARIVPARGRYEVKAARGSSPFIAVRGNDAARGGCPCVVVLQKSVGRPRAQRSAQSVSVGSKARPLQRGV